MTKIIYTIIIQNPSPDQLLIWWSNRTFLLLRKGYIIVNLHKYSSLSSRWLLRQLLCDDFPSSPILVSFLPLSYNKYPSDPKSVSDLLSNNLLRAISSSFHFYSLSYLYCHPHLSRFLPIFRTYAFYHYSLQRKVSVSPNRFRHFPSEAEAKHDGPR